MKNNKIIDIKDKLYEKRLIDNIKKNGLENYINTDIEFQLSHKEKNLLILTTYNSISIIEDLLLSNEEESKDLETVSVLIDTGNDLESLLNVLRSSLEENKTFKIKPLNIIWILISLEIGGFINSEDEYIESWNEEEYSILSSLFDKTFEQAKVIYKVASPYDIPDILKNS